MPVEFSRTTAKKTITLPNSQTVNIPVITEISFIDPHERYQETQYGVDNSSEADRAVRTVNVFPSGNHSATPIEVERLDEWRVIDRADRGWETRVGFDNIDGETNNPPSFDIANGGAHLKTHRVRYYNNISDKNSNWVDVEYIDSFTVTDPHSRYQQTIYSLNNPTQDDADSMDLAGEPDVTDGAIDPPYRTDPFQNIVDFGANTSVTLRWIFTLNQHITHLSGAGNGGVCDIVAPAGSTVAGQFATSVDISAFSSPTIPPGITVTGSPSITPSTFSFGDWTQISGGGMVPGLYITDSATVNLVDETLESLGIGYYGDALGDPGIYGGAIVTGTSSYGSTTIDASSITVSAGGPSWMRAYTEISVSVGAVTITQVFVP